MIDLVEIRRTLEERRTTLTADLQRLTEPPKAGVNLSFGKRVGDGTTEAVERINTTATARSITASLAGIERALAKIDEGTYGICDECNEPIPSERLEARPASTLCVRCRSKAES